jgi:hypothetical protein
MNTIKKKILDTIEKKHLAPRPRWQFVVKNNTLWFLAGLAMLIGGFAVAVIIFILTDADWDIFVYLDKTPLQAILTMIPYIWLVVLLIVVIVSDTGIARTTHGYKYTKRVLISGSILGSVLIGTLLYLFGFGHTLHKTLVHQMPWYQNMTYTKRDQWFNPEKGLLSGTIVSIGKDTLTLTAPDKTLWTAAAMMPEVFEEEDLSIGLHIKLIGDKTGDKTFTIQDLRLWND